MLAVLTTACDGSADGSGPTATVSEAGPASPTITATETVTASETVTATETATPTPTPRPAEGPRPSLGGDDFDVAWSVDVTREDGTWCLTARAEGETQRACGETVTLDEVHGGREVVSAVEFQLGSLDITAGLVAEHVAQVRLETAPPPEDPDGGTIENLEPLDVLVGLNAYADADLDPTPEEPDLPTVRVVALDLTGDEVGEAEPTAAGTGS